MPIPQLEPIARSAAQNHTLSALSDLYPAMDIIEKNQPDNADLVSSLKMIRALVGYGQSRQNTAHPETLDTIVTLAANTDRLQGDPAPDKSEKARIYKLNHAAFRNLKLAIASGISFSEAEMEALQSHILAIEWEISDKTLARFDTQMADLYSRCRPGSVLAPLLKIMLSTGRYIRAKRSDAHTDSVTFLRDTFTRFEQIIQSPEMDSEQKKALLEQSVQAFNRFKRKIRQRPAPFEPDRQKDETGPPAALAEGAHDEELPPALSHLGQDSGPMDDPEFELTELPDSGPDAPGSLESLVQDIPAADPAAARSNGPDVMDDLFTVKESPADELLDAIHLMDVHPDGERQALKMLDQNDASANIQNLSPTRKSTAPIPEIGDRLDEFFNLSEPDLPGSEHQPGKPIDAALNPDDRMSQTPTGPPALESGTTETDPGESGIVPFSYEDEDRQAGESETQPPEKEAHEPGLDTMASFLAADSWETDRFSLQSIQKECFNLKEVWPEDSDKAKLVDMILVLSRALEEHTRNSETSGPPDSAPREKSQKKKGLFQRIFSGLTSYNP